MMKFPTHATMNTYATSARFCAYSDSSCNQCNPLGHQLGPTPAEIQARLDKERERKEKWEHRKQAQIELDLRGKLVDHDTK